MEELHLWKPHVGGLVPFNVKISAVTLAQLHPMWPLKLISSKITIVLTSKVQLWKLKVQVERGGTVEETVQATELFQKQTVRIITISIV
jgi:hypothetical protein